MTFKFQIKYFALAVVLFVAEVIIAVYVNDRFVRPYVGDFLVVILIYCFVKSFLNTRVMSTALCVLVFAYLVEVLQYFKLVKILGLEKSQLARTIIGTSFAWSDLIAYTLGIIVVLVAENEQANASIKRLFRI